MLPTWLRLKPHWTRFSADSCNGVSLHPSQAYLATSSGQRHFDSHHDDDSDSDEEAGAARPTAVAPDNCIRLWAIDLQGRGLNNNEVAR